MTYDNDQQLYCKYVANKNHAFYNESGEALKALDPNWI